MEYLFAQGSAHLVTRQDRKTLIRGRRVRRVATRSIVGVGSRFRKTSAHDWRIFQVHTSVTTNYSTAVLMKMDSKIFNAGACNAHDTQRSLPKPTIRVNPDRPKACLLDAYNNLRERVDRCRGSHTLDEQIRFEAMRIWLTSDGLIRSSYIRSYVKLSQLYLHITIIKEVNQLIV